MALIETIREKLLSAGLWIVEKFRRWTQIIKTSSEKQRIDRQIRSLYEKLGRTIYESKGEEMSACREICDEIDGLSDRREALIQQDIVLRRRVRCPRCGAAMDKGAKFCSACGAAMPEDTPSEE